MAPQVTQTPPGEPDAFAGRFGPTLENWKRKLLDLTKRNRALNFKPTPVSTLAIVDEVPGEVFRTLYVREQSMRFKAAPEHSGKDKPAAVAAGEESFDLAHYVSGSIPEEDQVGASDFVPYDAAMLGEQHTDDWLQTSSDPERLDRSLRRIDEQARSTIEEQGVNTLFVALGMLHYRESADSDTVLRAPLVMLPVELSRKSARAGYTVAAADEDAIVNPALAEYLRLSFGIKLPELPDAGSLTDEYDLQDFLRAATEAVASHQEWAVKTEVYLGLFSFHKFVMFKDLEANGAAIQAHRLIRQLLTRTGSAVIGLPADIRNLELDTSFTPESTFQVVDADASQLRAAAAVAKGHDVVIEGPPGTGKSQTITNLIAQALAANKTVLFVAEKMAALQVVYRRLAKAGLGEFALELHSGKANKRLVLKDLANTLDLSLQPIAGTTAATERLPVVRATLNEYVRAVHEPFGQIAVTPYRAYGELGLVLEAPRVAVELDVEKVSRQEFDEAVRALEDLAVHVSYIGNPQTHPWRDTTRSLYTQDDVEEVTERAARIAQRAKSIQQDSQVATEEFGVPTVKKCADADVLPVIANLIAESPGAPIEVLQSDRWNAASATALIETGRGFSRILAEITEKLMPDAFDHDHAEDIRYIERKTSGIFGWLAVFDGNYRLIRGRWRAYWKEGIRPSRSDQLKALRMVQDARVLKEQLRRASGNDLFGALWRANQSDWASLQRYVDWVVRFRAAVVQHGLSGRAAVVSAAPDVDVQPLKVLHAAVVTIRQEIRHLEELIGWPSDYLTSLDIDTIATRCENLAANPRLAATWAAFHDARSHARSTVARDVVTAGEDGHVGYDQAASTFKRAFYMRLVSRMVDSRPPLKHFHTLSHEQRVQEFRRLDRLVLCQNQAALVGLLRDRAQQRIQEGAAAAGLAQLRREMARQRGISPLRRTFRQCEATIKAIKPCLMVSPLTAAQ